MSDLLLEISKRPMARSVYNRLPVPIRLPQALERGSGPWPERPLEGRAIAVASTVKRALEDRLRALLSQAGAKMDTGETWNGLVFDATEARRPADLATAYEFLHQRIRQLRPGAHVAVIGRQPAPDDSAAWATQSALDGLVKSVAKEIGGRGATAQLLVLPAGSDPQDAEARLAGPLLFFLSTRSAFISGQTVVLHGGTTSAVGYSLAGKRALVTGAAQGIGEAIAVALHAQGAHIIGVDHPSQQQTLERAMRAIGGESVTVDLREESAAEAVKRAAGKLDIVVNNAGITRDKTLAKMERDAWDAVIGVNLEAPLRLTEALAPGLAEGGRLIYLSSVVGISGNLGQTNYSSAKAGIIGFVRHRAEAFARRGITINAIAPGFIETAMTKRIPLATREVARRLNSLKQGGLPTDVAECAAFLASPGAFAVTGAAVRVCGQSLIGA